MKHTATIILDAILAILATPLLLGALIAYQGGKGMFSLFKKQQRLRNNIYGTIPVGDKSVFLDILTDPAGLAIRTTNGESVTIPAGCVFHLAGILTMAAGDLPALLKSKGILWG
jgi:hypothetical protein